MPDYKITKEEQRRIDEDQRWWKERHRQHPEISSMAIATAVATGATQQIEELLKDTSPEYQERLNSWMRELNSNPGAFLILDSNGLPLIEKSLPKVRYLIAKETDDAKRSWLLGMLRQLELRVNLGCD